MYSVSRLSLSLTVEAIGLSGTVSLALSAANAAAKSAKTLQPPSAVPLVTKASEASGAQDSQDQSDKDTITIPWGSVSCSCKISHFVFRKKETILQIRIMICHSGQPSPVICTLL